MSLMLKFAITIILLITYGLEVFDVNISLLLGIGLLYIIADALKDIESRNRRMYTQQQQMRTRNQTLPLKKAKGGMINTKSKIGLTPRG